MASFERFNFKTIDDLKRKIEELKVNIKLSEDLSPLAKPVKVGHLTAPNSIAILPMEGCDSNRDGSPSDLVRRRYRRFASGGAGLIWFEACAVVHEGRANPLQMFLTKENVKQFAELVKETDKAAAEANGAGHRPVKILQLTHSGRYSRPDDLPAPMIPQHDPMLDPAAGLSPDAPVLSDEYFDNLTQKYVESALLAKEAGFDGVDIKSCHRYLLSELAASHMREGKYGGAFENRTRFILNTIKAVREKVGDDFIVASRFNVFDAHPYPYGFGVDKENYMKPDLTEPLKLVRKMIENGVNLLGSSAGNPYYKAVYVTRPFDTPVIGGEMPEEHPLESVARLFELTRQVQREAKDIPVIGSGYTWLRWFLPYAGAANLLEGACGMMGLGRQAIAYPDAPGDILTKGRMEPNKCCITCSKCTQIMRDHGRTGCVMRDSEVYLPLYNEARKNASKK